MTTSSPSRHLQKATDFYALLDELEGRVGGRRTLNECDGYFDWPDRGVYFFFEPGEERTDSGQGLRITRVGTHALGEGARATLWQRLRQHRGTLSGKYAGGGNHRGSIFRLHVGLALKSRDKIDLAPEWGKGSTAPAQVRQQELELERLVSAHIRKMPFLWLEVSDPAGPESDRAYIERNAIALLSNLRADPAEECLVDPPSDGWLGLHSAAGEIRRSGVWNVDHVHGSPDGDFIRRLDDHVRRM